uniref:Transcriptional regulator n=2 Tax=Caenorhabditis tropicalis TaxID=1561998 RepID=A0A1I7T894_9PELO
MILMRTIERVFEIYYHTIFQMPRSIIDLSFRPERQVAPFVHQTVLRQQMTVVNMGVPENPPPAGIRRRLKNAWAWLKEVIIN